jgi:hypothetical protein
LLHSSQPPIIKSFFSSLAGLNPKRTDNNMHKHQDTHLINKSSTATSASYSHQPHVVFRLGKLRFGLHGLLGILALTFTVTAYYQYPTNLAVLAVSQLLNGAISYHAATLLPQVPPFTQIVPGIVAPHKEAFRRTISVMYYLIARVTLAVCAAPAMGILLGTTGIGSSDNDNAQSTALQRDEYSRYLCCAVLAWFWWPLVPSWQNSSQLWNGNTWIFVFPIFVGVTGDFWQYIAYRDVIPVEQLLQTEILGLVLAFSFTLAFRNYVSMPTVYVGAALAVFKTMKEAYTTIQAGTAAAAVV